MRHAESHILFFTSQNNKQWIACNALFDITQFIYRRENLKKQQDKNAANSGMDWGFILSRSNLYLFSKSLKKKFFISLHDKER